MTIYYDHINNRKFTNLLRMLWGKPVVDLQFLCDIVMTEEAVLDCEAVVNSSVPLKVLASSVERGEIEVLDQFQSGLDLLNALHASARMPWAAGGDPLEYRGQSYWDSGIVDPFAIKSALADRCTHLLVLRSRPRGLARRRLNIFERLVILPHIKRRSVKLAEYFRTRFDPKVNGLVKLQESDRSPESAPHLLGVMAPVGTFNIPRLETRRTRLMQGALDGVNSVLTLFGREKVASLEG